MIFQIDVRMQHMVYSLLTAVKNENSAHERRTRVSLNARGFLYLLLFFDTAFKKTLMLLY